MGRKGKSDDPERKELNYDKFGLEFQHESGSQSVYLCPNPACGDESGHFYVDPGTTMFYCQRCKAKGNWKSFLKQFVQWSAPQTTTRDWNRLSRHRGGIPSVAFKRVGIVKNPYKPYYMIPVITKEGRWDDVRRYYPPGAQGRGRGSRTYASPECSVGLWNAQELFERKKKDWAVDVCEGELDGAAMKYFNQKIGRKAIVVAVPGAGVFKDEWVEWLSGRDVNWWYDNDDAGYDGSLNAAVKCAEAVGEQSFVHWPEHFDKGHDITDFIAGGVVIRELKYKATAKFLFALLRDRHMRATEKEEKEIAREIRQRPEDNIDWGEFIERFRLTMLMTQELEDALAVCCAVILSNQFSKNRSPVWLFLVGNPSAGKTLILSASNGLPDVVYLSRISPKQLVSGFATKDGKDPSVIPRLIKAGCGVFKDFTELIGAGDVDQHTFGVLRGAFDGTVDVFFGNGIERRFQGQFALLAGVTKKIFAHSEAAVGDRFLRYVLSDATHDREDAVMSFTQSWDDDADHGEEDRQAAMKEFLDRDVRFMKDPLREHHATQIRLWSALVARLRAEPDWKTEGGETYLSYIPGAESPIRVCEQLTRLARALCAVYGTKRTNAKIMKLVGRVAFDTATGMYKDLVGVLMNGPKRGMSVEDMVECVPFGRSTVQRYLKDLEALRYVAHKQGSDTGGRPRNLYYTTDAVADLKPLLQGRTKRTVHRKKRRL